MTERLSTPMRAKLWLFSAMLLLQPAIAFAQKKGKGLAAPTVDVGETPLSGGDSFANKPLVLMMALAAMSLAPFVDRKSVV